MRAPKVPLDVSTNDQHCFAVYLPHLDQLERAPNGRLITDLSVIHRMHTVLRLQAGDTCIVFDDQHHVYATLKEISRKRIVVELSSKIPHTPIAAVLFIGFYQFLSVKLLRKPFIRLRKWVLQPFSLSIRQRHLVHGVLKRIMRVLDRS